MVSVCFKPFFVKILHVMSSKHINKINCSLDAYHEFLYPGDVIQITEVEDINIKAGILFS